MSKKLEITRPKTIHFDNFFVESPQRKRVLIPAVNAYAPDYACHGYLATQKRDEKWCQDLVKVARSLGAPETITHEITGASFRPLRLLENLKEVGFKVFWQREESQ